MSPEEQKGRGYDWTSMISSMLSGAGPGITAAATPNSSYNNREESQEMRRRTNADILKRRLGRNRSSFKTSQDMSGNGQDLENQIVQEIARGFIESMKGGM